MNNLLHDSSQVHQEVWVVAACFNEQAVITDFIKRALSIPGVSRLILVDDGSTDSTVQRIRQFKKEYSIMQLRA